MKIKIILQCYYRRRDINGNCYWYAKATNTNTGRSVVWETPHSSNAESSVRNAGFEWDEIYNAPSCELYARQYDARIRGMKKYDEILYDSCKDAHIVKAIRDLRFKKQR